MKFINLSVEDRIAQVIIDRPKVNALNESVVDELHQCFNKLALDDEVKSIVLSGEGSFFSFGLDVPEFYSYSKEEFLGFMFRFSSLLKALFLFPKPVVGALNGHAIAGGCMLAMTCDYRLMVSEKAKISLNELTFGSTLFSTGVEMLRFLIGDNKASRIVYSGSMYSPEDALQLGLIDELVPIENFRSSALKIAKDFSGKGSIAFHSLKLLLRRQTANEIERSERDSIAEFVDIWYSDNARNYLKNIKIRE